MKHIILSMVLLFAIFNIAKSDKCSNIVCQNDGVCINGFCMCKFGFVGQFCQIAQKEEINKRNEGDSCLLNPCQNGGLCTNGDNDYQCTCLPTFYGVNCEKKIKQNNVVVQDFFGGKCSEECQNGGTCYGSWCMCKKEFTGEFCQEKINNRKRRFLKINNVDNEYQGGSNQLPYKECDTKDNICFNGGVCWQWIEDNKVNRNCACPVGTSGQFCEVVKITVCDSRSCHNGGVCTKAGCVCPSGYSGDSCQILKVSELCKNVDCYTGKCVVTYPNGKPTAKCSCKDYSGGYHCEIGYDGRTCAETQCRNHVGCVDRYYKADRPGYSDFTSAHCQCAPGYSGYRCSKNYFICKAEGNFSDPEGCKFGRYFECKRDAQNNFILSRRECPAGLRFNTITGVCDLVQNLKFQC